MAEVAGTAKRPKNFAYKFCRLMAKAVLANELGPNACWFLTVIVMTEDARHYRGPVNFWNQQLMGAAGIGSVPALVRIRDRCVEAGWLHYTPGTNRRPGTYRVTVPDQLKDVKDDTALGEDERDFQATEAHGSSNAGVTRTVTRSGAEALPEPVGEASSSNAGVTRTVTRSGAEADSKRSPSIPDPDPDPNSVPSERSAAEPPTASDHGGSPGASVPVAKPTRPHNSLFDAIAEVTGSDPSLRNTAAHVGKVAAALAKADPPYTPADVREFARRYLEICTHREGTGRTRPTIGEVEKYVCQVRAGPGAAIPPPPKRKFETQDDRNIRMLRDIIPREEP